MCAAAFAAISIFASCSKEDDGSSYYPSALVGVWREVKSVYYEKENGRWTVVREVVFKEEYPDEEPWVLSLSADGLYSETLLEYAFDDWDGYYKVINNILYLYWDKDMTNEEIIEEGDAEHIEVLTDTTLVLAEYDDDSKYEMHYVRVY